MDRLNIMADTVLLGLGRVRDWLHGCAHRQTSFPITLRTGRGTDEKLETYIVCLSCARQLAYDWTTMRRSKRPAEAHRVTVLQGSGEARGDL